MPQKNKNINFIIPMGHYPFDLMVSIDQTDKQLGKSLDATGMRFPEKELKLCWYWGDNCHGRYVMFSSGQSLIRLRQKPDTPFLYGVMQHEIFHVVACLMDRIGMKLKIRVSDEAYSYRVQHLTEQIYKTLEQYPRQ